MISVILAASEASGMRLVHALMPLVAAAADGVVREVVVIARADEESASVAEAAGCRLVPAAGSAAGDLAAGADAARSDWLLFLVPSAVLQNGWHDEVAAFLDRAERMPAGRDRAAVFRHARPELGWRSRLGEAGAAVRSRLLAAPSVEQGLLISRVLYRRLGGHRNLPGSMTGIDLARRVGRRRLSLMRASAMAVQDPAGGPGAAFRRALCVALLAARVSPRWVARLAP